MAQYDLNLILNPNLGQEQVEIEKEFVKRAVENAGGEISNLDDMGNRRLAYAINKTREGYYLMYTIKVDGDPAKDIAAGLRLRDNVWRVVVIKDRPEWKTKKSA